jgi:hypothetical protein
MFEILQVNGLQRADMQLVPPGSIHYIFICFYVLTSEFCLRNVKINLSCSLFPPSEHRDRDRMIKIA